MQSSCHQPEVSDKCHVGDHIGHMALCLDQLALADHRRVVVYALAGKDLPEIKAGGIGAEVPFPNHGGLVAGALEKFGKCRLGAVESRPSGVIVDSIRMGVFPGEDGGTAGASDGIWVEATIKADTNPGDAVDVWGREEISAISVGADRRIGVGVGEDEDEIWRFRCGQLSGREREKEGAARASRDCVFRCRLAQVGDRLAKGGGRHGWTDSPAALEVDFLGMGGNAALVSLQLRHNGIDGRGTDEVVLLAYPGITGDFMKVREASNRDILRHTPACGPEPINDRKRSADDDGIGPEVPDPSAERVVVVRAGEQDRGAV